MKEHIVRKLSDVEHVRKKPGMYVGACQKEKLMRWTLEDQKLVFKEIEFTPALMKMFDEIISNSIDEAIRTNFKRANDIRVTLKSDHVIVVDNGGGIPVVPSIDDPTITQAELALTHLRSGTNFVNDETVSIGTHGLGASLVNILSKKFVAWSDDGKKRQHIRCVDQMREIKTNITESFSSGVYVEYWPDFSMFDCSDMSGDLEVLLKKRVYDLAVNFPKIKFTLNGQQIKSTSFKKYVELIGSPFEIIETDDFKVAVVASEEYNQISFVNGIDTYEGGTHIDYVRNKIVPAVLEHLNKKYKKLKLSFVDVKNKLTFVVMSASIKKPKFRSQTKEYITNNQNEMAAVFQDVDDESFIKKIIRNEAIVNGIIETKQFKIQLEEAREAAAKQKDMKKVRVPKHIPANGDPSKTMLFITEGDSASGPFTKARNPDLHGAFPLRGVPMNTYGEKPINILSNKELMELMSVLGLKFGDGPDTKLNYGKIGIMADADYDGHKIGCLMLVFFSHWPWLFEQGRIFLVRCPIMKAVRGKEIKRFYTLEEFTKANLDDSWKLTYLKGLGSLTPDEYEIMINQPVLDQVSTDQKSQEMLEVVFGEDAQKRKEWLGSV